jgi:hypothetical protein
MYGIDRRSHRVRGGHHNLQSIQTKPVTSCFYWVQLEASITAQFKIRTVTIARRNTISDFGMIENPTGRGRSGYRNHRYSSQFLEFPNRDRFFGLDCLIFRYDVGPLRQPRWRGCTTASEHFLPASGSIHVYADAEAGCSVSLNNDSVADCIRWNPSKTIFSSVIKN